MNEGTIDKGRCGCCGRRFYYTSPRAKNEEGQTLAVCRDCWKERQAGLSWGQAKVMVLSVGGTR